MIDHISYLQLSLPLGTCLQRVQFEGRKGINLAEQLTMRTV